MSQDTTAGPGAAESKGTHGGRRNTVDARLSAKERSAKALQLRLMRHSYDTIARQLGYSNRSAARKAVEREIAAVPREPAKELREQELESLDMAQRALMPSVLAGHLGAVDRLVKIMDSRAKLTGLYENIGDSGIDEFKSVLKQWAAQIAVEVAKDESESQRESRVTDDEAERPDDAPTIDA